MWEESAGTADARACNKKEILWMRRNSTQQIAGNVNLAYLDAVAIAKAVVHVRHGSPLYVCSSMRRY